MKPQKLAITTVSSHVYQIVRARHRVWIAEDLQAQKCSSKLLRIAAHRWFPGWQRQHVLLSLYVSSDVCFTGLKDRKWGPGVQVEPREGPVLCFLALLAMSNVCLQLVLWLHFLHGNGAQYNTYQLLSNSMALANGMFHTLPVSV